MRNNIYSELKKKKKEENFINIDTIILHISDDSIDHNLLKEEQIKLLKKSLLKLNSEDLKLIYDLYYLNKKLKDLSITNNINYYTLATKKRRVINKLRKIYLNNY